MADRKISDLTALTTPASGDFLPIVDISEAAAASKNKRITIEELFRGVPLGTAAAPSIAIEGDEDTGVFSPGANQLAVATNGTGRLFVDASGNVNIGANTSIGKLTVWSANNGDVLAAFRCAGIGTQRAFYISGDNSTGDISLNASGAAGGNIVFQSGGNELVRFNQSGHVGIGTVPSAWSAFTVLQVKDSSVSSTGGDLNLMANAYYDGANYLRIGATGAGRQYFNTDGSITWQQAGSGSAGSTISFSTPMTLDSSGRLGIGVTNSVGKLTVATSSANPSAGLNSWSDGYLVIAPGGTTTSGGVGLSFNTSSNVGGISCATPGSAWRDLIYKASAHRFELGGSEAARIDSSSRLLVGTSSSASYPFSVSPNLQVESTSYQRSGISIWNNETNDAGGQFVLGKSRGTANGSNTVVQNGDFLGTIYFVGADGVDRLSFGASIAAIVDGTPGADDLPSRLEFSSTPSGSASPVERMRITSGGQVLIGRTSVVSGYNSTLSLDYTTGTQYGFTLRNTAASTFGAIVFVNSSNTLVGEISVSTTATTYATSSDYRLKENVVPLSGAIDRVNDLQVHRFNFIANPDQTVDGFIAHEAQAVVPECVTGEKDAVDDDGNPVYQGIDQSKLVPLLTAALQEAIGEIESLKARLTAAGI
jgi:hypothetical protein